MNTTFKGNIFKVIFLSGLLIFTAHIPAEEIDNQDPWESFNRSVYGFNLTLDKALKPIAKTYRDYMPEFVQTGVGNFFENIGDIDTMLNQLLQAKVQQSAKSLLRFGVNSTAGIAGFIEVIEREEKEDLGQTLAVWGFDSGPYLVLPLIGPSTIRDSASVVSNLLFIDDISIENINDSNTKVALYTARVIDKRVNLLPITDILEKNDDPYVATRSSYFQRRHYDIYDGKVRLEIDDF